MSLTLGTGGDDNFKTRGCRRNGDCVGLCPHTCDHAACQAAHSLFVRCISLETMCRYGLVSMSSMNNELKALRSEVEELRAFKAQVEEEDRDNRSHRIKRAGAMASFAGRLFLGKNLTIAFKEWQGRVSSTDPFPFPETPNLAEAVLRRFVRVGLFTIAIAVLAEGILVCQTTLLAEQNTLINSQNQFWQQQIRQEAVQDYRAQRAELVETLYKVRQCPTRKANRAELETCYVAPPKARAEALQALVEIEAAIRAGCNAIKESQNPAIKMSHPGHL